MPAMLEGTTTKDYNGITSTSLPRLELIPKAALESLAKRFELGIERKGDGAWNALTPHMDKATKEFVIERLAHCIHHCYDAIAKVNEDVEFLGEDDAGAIMFAGAVLAVWNKRRLQQ